MVKPLPKPISVAEYLESELESDVRREYVGGQIYAIAGVSFASQSDWGRFLYR